MWIDRAVAWFDTAPTPVAALLMLFGPLTLVGYALYRGARWVIVRAA